LENYIKYVTTNGKKVFKAKIRDNKTIYAKAPEDGILVVLNKPKLLIKNLKN